MIRKPKALLGLFALAALQTALAGTPAILDHQFQIPDGFHIYKAATGALTQGSYVLCFDGDGHLLVGTGSTIRRLQDDDQDGVYDSAIDIVDGLGPRGPQGMLVYGDKLYAVGGDGVQHYTGYPDNLVHQGRLGEPFHTGGDHAAHTLLRGHDDWIYFVTGDGGGARDQVHITEETSPVRRERNASVFRFNLSGSRWECISTGGRNPPNLGMNSIGELFSLDSDMEWHVDVPWYRPVRLNHWAVGADLGWQGVGAYPPYYIDTIPGVVDAGRGSPTWGMFYEHEQFPENYQNAFLVCDYRWKSATKGSYNSNGRLLSFSIELDGASWKSEMEILATPKPNAQDATGKKIDFALVDATVAPDGSLFISDHNQGIWRLFYQNPQDEASVSIPVLLPASPKFQGTRMEIIETALALPQPQSEWTRLKTLEAKKKLGVSWRPALQKYALDEARPLEKRLRALRLVSPEYSRISGSFFARLAKSSHEVLRGQAAWLTGLQGRPYHPQILNPLLSDRSPFVRRRAAEALTRVIPIKSAAPLVEALGDKDRMVRYAAMQALSRLPSSAWFEQAVASESPQRTMRALVAAKNREELPESNRILELVNRLIAQAPSRQEDRLDLLRVLELFKGELVNDLNSRAVVANYLHQGFPAENKDIRWEQARLLGSFQVTQSIPKLLNELERAPEGVTQFHLADALSRIRSGWETDATTRLTQWLVSHQSGWFADFSGKGLQFPSFWGTVLKRFHEQHSAALERALGQLSPNSQLGNMVVGQFVKKEGAENQLIQLYKTASKPSDQLALVKAMEQKKADLLRGFARQELSLSKKNSPLNAALVGLLLAQGSELQDVPLLWDHFTAQDSRSYLGPIASQFESLALKHGRATIRQSLGLQTSTQNNRATLETIIQRLGIVPQADPAFDTVLNMIADQDRNNRLGEPRWIWARVQGAHVPTTFFRRRFQVEADAQALLEISGDNEYSAYLDGKLVSENDEWTRPGSEQVFLNAGSHELAIRVKSEDPTAGLLASLTWAERGGVRAKRLVSNVGWTTSNQQPTDWPHTKDAKIRWQPARDLGAHGVSPWGQVLDTSARDTIGSTLISNFWNTWFENQFGRRVTDITSSKTVTKEEARQILVHGSLEEGDQKRGQAIYQRVQCHSCHQGLPSGAGRIFGPDLAGVTRRLTREQLADAILLPSKDVAERFRAMEIETKNATSLSGFITEQSVDQYVIATQNQIHAIPASEIESIQPLESSLMPEGLLEGSSRQDILDLLRFLDGL